MKLSVIVPSLTGDVPSCLRRQVEGRTDVEMVVVAGVRPVGRARNEGLERARGDYVAWVDADDEVTEDWLAEILSSLDGQVDVLTFDAERIGGGGPSRIAWEMPPEDVSVPQLIRDVCRERRRHGFLFLYVTRRKLWDGLRFDESVRVGEDCLLLPQVLLRADSCRYVSKALYRYVFNERSLTRCGEAGRDLEFLHVWLRRMDQMPREYRRPCVWGLATMGYWICDVNAAGDAGCGPVIRQYRLAILRHFVPLLRELLFQCEFPLRERMVWLMRIVCLVSGCWFVQKLRARRRR